MFPYEERERNVSQVGLLKKPGIHPQTVGIWEELSTRVAAQNNLTSAEEGVLVSPSFAQSFLGKNFTR